MATKIIADRRINYSTIKDRLERLKANTQDSYQYFSHNYDHFNKMMKFIMKTSLSDDEVSMYKELGRPTLEFNILEAYGSRILGEFAKQEPSILVSSADDSMNETDPYLIEFLESHMRAFLHHSNKDHMTSKVFRDMCYGGFGVVKVYTDWASERSFNQNILMRSVFDPTLTFFDKMARESHKGDGMFAGECFPKTKEEFEAEYGSKYSKNMRFTRNVSGFNWTYNTDGQDFILMCEYFEKMKYETKIVQLVNGQTMTVDEYEKMLEEWNNGIGMMIAPPGVVGKSRKAESTKIARSIFIENEVLEYAETDYRYLPYVFFSGNSVLLRDAGNGSASQLTLSYFHHAESIQRLKNFAGVQLANELENMVQHKWMASLEAIPPEYKDAYIDVQKASVLIYNQYKDNDPNIPLNPPQAIPRVPAPPELMTTFSMSDDVTQHILGSYNAALGINDNELSGIAIQEGAMQSNATIAPYLNGYICGLNQVALIVLDLIPKYWTQPRKVPIINMRGKHSHEVINMPGKLQMDFDPDALHVKLEAGVNFEIQKSRSLKVLEGLMRVSPKMAEYLGNTEEGLETLLNCLDLPGIDVLKDGVGKFIKQQEQKEQQMQQISMQMNPVAAKLKEIESKDRQAMMTHQQKEQEMIVNSQLKAAGLSIEKEKADDERLKTFAEIGEIIANPMLEAEKISAQNARTAVDAAISEASHHHSKAMDILSLHHENENARMDREMNSAPTSL
jgi:Phage P22-like portal protein